MGQDTTQESFQDQEDFELPEEKDIDEKEDANHIVCGPIIPHIIFVTAD